jgi:hypothetical protein
MPSPHAADKRTQASVARLVCGLMYGEPLEESTGLRIVRQTAWLSARGGEYGASH